MLRIESVVKAVVKNLSLRIWSFYYSCWESYDRYTYKAWGIHSLPCNFEAHILVRVVQPSALEFRNTLNCGMLPSGKSFISHETNRQQSHVITLRYILPRVCQHLPQRYVSPVVPTHTYKSHATSIPFVNNFVTVLGFFSLLVSGI